MSLENFIYRCLETFWALKDHKRHGTVTSYDPDKHAAKVQLQPGGQETGWLPIHAHLVGDGWGVVAGLNVGDQVEVAFENGDLDIGKIASRVHSDKEKPPKVQAGELLATKKDTGSILWDNDGNITWTGANGQVIKTDKKGNTSITLNVSNTQNSDSNSPTLTVTLKDQNNKNHSVTVNKDGIAHASDVKVSITSQKIEHNGPLKVNGSIYSSGVVQTTVGVKAPIYSAGTTGDPGDASTW